MKKLKAYIYTRVSTAMQVDGYSLDAQRDKIERYAEMHDIEIVGEYSDRGKSGKSIEDRLEFQKMIDDMQKNDVNLILVFKLSRFGRNVADILNTLDVMKLHDIDLVCVEDGIDSRNEMSKIVIAVMSAIAEAERENIRTQTIAGRMQKAKVGKWNGGFAPTGYKVNKENASLDIHEDEAEIVRIIFDKYVNENMTLGGIARYLKSKGYKREDRPNSKTEYYSSSLIGRIIDSEVYMGKISYGKRRNEQIKGTRKYHHVKKDDYMVVDGLHDAIISEELWNKAHKKREASKNDNKNRFRSNGHRYILSNLIICPSCGKGLTGATTKGRKKADGTCYVDRHYYRCRHVAGVEGYECDFRKTYNAEKIDKAVVEVITKVVSDRKIAEIVKSKISVAVDMEVFDNEIARLKKSLTDLKTKESSLIKMISMLDINDRFYEKKYSNYDNQLNGVYDELENINELLEESISRKEEYEENQINAEKVYKLLQHFDKIYDKLNDDQKYDFMHAMIESIELYDEEREDKKVIKEITLSIPVMLDGKVTNKICLPNATHVESVVQMSK